MNEESNLREPQPSYCSGFDASKRASNLKINISYHTSIYVDINNLAWTAPDSTVTL